jgi:2-polyprenyl-3-methyl-5-hydroxy-6-metoxy-1,4-benzoquinol methylase
MAHATQTSPKQDNPIATPATSELAALKTRQQAAWSSGNYAVVGTTLQIVGEQLCEALDLRSGVKVLDVAAGNGMASLAAARRWCNVTSTDYVPALLERGRARASAEGLPIEFDSEIVILSILSRRDVLEEIAEPHGERFGILRESDGDS